MPVGSTAVWHGEAVPHSPSLTLTLTVTLLPCPSQVRSGAGKLEAWSSLSDPWLYDMSMIHIPSLGHRAPSGELTALALALGEEGEADLGLGSWAGAWREEAGLGRAELALAELLCSLWMMWSMQDWFRGAAW